LLARRWHVLALAPPVHDRRTADELPHVFVERAEFALNLQERARVTDCGLDLLSVAHDGGVVHQFLDRARGEARDLRRVEIGEGATIAVALAQNRPPAQAS